MSIRTIREMRSRTDATFVAFVEVIDEIGGRVVYEAHCDTCEGLSETSANLGQFEHLQDALDLLADHTCSDAGVPPAGPELLVWLLQLACWAYDVSTPGQPAPLGVVVDVARLSDASWRTIIVEVERPGLRSEFVAELREERVVAVRDASGEGSCSFCGGPLGLYALEAEPGERFCALSCFTLDTEQLWSPSRTVWMSVGDELARGTGRVGLENARVDLSSTVAGAAP